MCAHPCANSVSAGVYTHVQLCTCVCVCVCVCAKEGVAHTGQVRPWPEVLGIIFKSLSQTGGRGLEQMTSQGP